MDNTSPEASAIRTGLIGLTGALIGLARATEGNINRPTASTHKALLMGMKTALFSQEASAQQKSECIDLLHREKEKLVPRCSTCKKPCGRNHDYDIFELDEQDPELSAARYALLSEPLILEPLLHYCPDRINVIGFPLSRANIHGRYVHENFLRCDVAKIFSDFNF